MQDGPPGITFKSILARVRDKTRNRDQLYYDRLSQLFEKAAWATIIWAILVNVYSPLDFKDKGNVSLVIAFAAVFNFVYFRFVYPRLKEKDYRFFLSEAGFPVFIWMFLHFQQELLPYLSLPYYILILATSLTLRGVDSAIAIFASLLFVVIEDLVFKYPLDVPETEIFVTRTIGLLIFSYVVLAIRNFLRKQDLERASSETEAIKETEKNYILKRYTQELILDTQKVAIFAQESPTPFILIDSRHKILEYNLSFKRLSDFKDNGLVGKDISFVLSLSEPLRINATSYLPEDFTGEILTRRNKRKKVVGKAHFMLGNDKRLKQILLFLTEEKG